MQNDIQNNVQVYEFNGVPVEPAVYKQIVRLVRSGSKLESMKLLKDSTGLELKECKDIIDGLAKPESRLRDGDDVVDLTKERGFFAKLFGGKNS